MLMEITVFPDRFATHCERRAVAWSDLCAYLQTPPEYPSKQACPLLKLATFGEVLSAKGSLRHDSNVLAVYGVEGDHDVGLLSPAEGAALLRAAGVRAVLYTTASHTPAAPRWRVLAPLSRSYAPHARRIFTEGLNTILGATLAPESFALSQTYYFGRVAGVPYEVHVVDGHYLDTLLPPLPLAVPAPPAPRAVAEALPDGPVPEWRGPTDDADLIRRALMSRSAASAFGGRACFADLWHAEAEALGRAYPDGGGRPYDASAADAALASHLAFWTGRDGVRIARLMRQSGLARDKYDRDDYLPRTIGAVLSAPGDVLKDKAPEPVGLAAAGAGTVEGAAVSGSTYLSAGDQLETFKGCVYILDRHRALIPGGGLLRPEQFRAAYGGYTFAMDTVNERVTRNAWEAFTESQAVRHPRADTICFRPDLPAAAIINDAGKTRANAFWPATVPRKQGDAGPFLAHLEKMLPDARDRAIVLAYMAACVQHQGIKFGWAPVIQGAEGNGKTMLCVIVAEAIGRHYTHWTDADGLASRFNGWVADKLFVAVEELKGQDHSAEEIVELLKTLITGGYGVRVEYKGVDETTLQIVANFLLLTNHKNAVRKTPDNNRRLAVFFTAQQIKADLDRDGMGGDYFPRLWAWLRAEGFAIMAEYLATYPIPDEFNPATLAHRAPNTSTSAQVMRESRGNIEQQIAEVIEQDTPGFMGGWVSSVALDRYLTETLRIGAKLSPSKRREIMHNLGYVLHPALKEGRVNNPVPPDNRRPQLFILSTHPALMLRDAGEVAKAYTAAQQVRPGV